jgi:hypothetical protein
MTLHVAVERPGGDNMPSADPDAALLTSPTFDALRPESQVSSAEEPELAAYNARLAELAAQGPKTWRKREAVVVRREQ